jgi:hypothetical protein
LVHRCVVARRYINSWCNCFNIGGATNRTPEREEVANI